MVARPSPNQNRNTFTSKGRERLTLEDITTRLVLLPFSQSHTLLSSTNSYAAHFFSLTRWLCNYSPVRTHPLSTPSLPRLQSHPSIPPPCMGITQDTALNSPGFLHLLSFQYRAANTDTDTRLVPFPDQQSSRSHRSNPSPRKSSSPLLVPDDRFPSGDRAWVSVQSAEWNPPEQSRITKVWSRGRSLLVQNRPCRMLNSPSSSHFCFKV